MGSIRESLAWIKPIHWALFALFAVGTFTAAYAQIANAACYPGTVLGRACYRGYFDNVEDHGGTNVMPEISDGLAMPMSIDTADELYNYLRSAYNSGNAQRRTGAAFIYNTMMGINGANASRTVTTAQWIELRNRLRGLDEAGKIRWTGNVAAPVNSFWQGVDAGFSPDGAHNDDTFYENYKNEAGIQIRDYNDNVVYELLRRCANPIGDPKQIPPTQNYELTPHIDSVTPSQVEAGGTVSVTGSVDNEGDVRSATTRWEITQITVQPGKLAPGENGNGTLSATAPCRGGGGSGTGNYFDSADADCKNVAGGSGRFNLGAPAQNIKPTANNVNVGDFPAGTRICFALSVRPHSNSDTRWAHSKPICTVIGKKPKLQVWGGDIKVRGAIDTSTSVKSNKTYGSWGEYGTFATNAISGFASGSGLSGGVNAPLAQQQQLTFANVDQAGTPSYGFYALSPGAPLSGQFAGGPFAGNATANLGNLASGVYQTGNLTINASQVGQQGGRGKTIVVVSSGTVTIAGNITYEGPGGSDTFTNANQIPQVVIIANAINVRNAVETIDAWLLTNPGGSINTCSDVALATALTTNTCNNPLTVNGPVQTSNLHLRRTAGSEDGARSGDPAELFNLRADAYIWGRRYSSQAGKAQTVYTQELPPRF